MKKLILLFLLSGCFIELRAQSHFIVEFTDKGASPFSFNNPAVFLSQKALDRRARYNIPLDSTDLPVSPGYLDSIRLAGNVTVLNPSRWLNSVSIVTTDASAISKISNFPFVRNFTAIAPKKPETNIPSHKLQSEESPISGNKPLEVMADFFNYGNSYNQIHIHHGEFLHNIGLRGEGMIIGMLDAGYLNYLNVRAFDSARARGQILGVYDFVKKDSSVNEDNAHGMQCLSTIASNIPGEFVGTAPYANFHLLRTENASTEFPIEEHNWVCGAERIDSAGGDVISSSLGYNSFDAPYQSFSHTYQDMNGNSTIPAIGADLAAKKGLLVINSAGNEGNNSWHYIITPADGDSVLAVGAVSQTGSVASFTSYGPASDGRIKPDVASVGVNTVVQLPNNVIGTSNGTSFACPNLAGLATCLWQGFPEFNNMQIIQALRQSGSNALQPNDRTGYGIPDMRKASLILLKQLASSNIQQSSCQVNLQWTSKDISSMVYEIERKTPDQMQFQKIGTIAAKGTEFSLQTYSFTDQLNNVPSGNITYRIRQVIDSSSISFSADYLDTVFVSNPVNCNYNPQEVITLIPNPARDVVGVRINLSEPIQNLVVRLFTAGGQLVYEEIIKKDNGIIIIDVPLVKLAKGKYFVTVYNDEKKMTVKELLKL